MSDEELFELCKEVYERTWWDRDDAKGIPVRYGYAPLYTSDYLLEKLPHEFKRDMLNMDKVGHSYCFRYGAASVAYYSKLEGESDTPLKALLKLTIALDDAGVKL